MIQQPSTLVLSGAQVARSYALGGVQTPAAPLPEFYFFTQQEWYGTGNNEWVNDTELPLQIVASSFAFRDQASGLAIAAGGKATWAVFTELPLMSTFASGLLTAPGLPDAIIPPGAKFRIDIITMPSNGFAQLGFMVLQRCALVDVVGF